MKISVLSKGVLGGVPPNKLPFVPKRRCLLVHTHSIPRRGIPNVPKNNSSFAPVAAAAPGVELHVLETVRVQDIFAVLPAVGYDLTGLLAAFRFYRDGHFQRFSDGDVILVHRSCSFLLVPRMGIPSRWQRVSFTSLPLGGGRFLTSYSLGITVWMAWAASLPAVSLSRWR